VNNTFHVLAFVENFSLKALASAYPEARQARHVLTYDAKGGGKVYVYSFGAIVFLDVDPPRRERELARLRKVVPEKNEAQVISDALNVQQTTGSRPEVKDGTLTLDELTDARASMVARTLAQSAAMEYYEGIVDQMFADTDRFAERLERTGTVPAFTRRLHRFIGAAISTRSEVLSVLHLLDKPDVVWDDSGAERIYETLRLEFDLVDRYEALSLKLRSVQDALSLVTDVARDRRLVLLEASIVLLIVFEIVLSLVRG
jgi:uncharacterized Rmd1/YagE family protein